LPISCYFRPPGTRIQGERKVIFPEALRSLRSGEKRIGRHYKTKGGVNLCPIEKDICLRENKTRESVGGQILQRGKRGIRATAQEKQFQTWLREPKWKAKPTVRAFTRTGV